MKALILAAGYATRLYPLTKEYPKPLLEVNKKPLIDYIVDKLENIEEVDEILVVTNSKFFSKFKKWQQKKKTNKRICVIDDLTKTNETKRGAIGDMYFVLKTKRLACDLLVIGGDNLFEEGLNNFLLFSKNLKTKPVLGVYDLKSKKKANHYGVVHVNSQNRITDFKEKPKNPGSSLVAMCVYYFPKSKLNLIKKYVADKNNKQDAAGFYIDWLRRIEETYAYKFSGKWYDIGDKQFLKEAQTRFK